ncbi:hypothetical protein [uncultured Mycolicibacterium sp.]|uniref:hypothetical protein n=1 Tax=uncultured Mycolicibacterium sp. TaxID=2320817 RepID=UPI00261357CE|nr:hypothetical protein [uncultured Mycolicibacterium sp.]
MGTPRTAARQVCGALVAACSAVLTVAAHLAAGGGVPSGGRLVCAGLAGAVIGALPAGLGSARDRSRPVQVVAALLAAQAVGHVTLAGTAAAHDHAAARPTAVMVAAHLAAALLLGAAISAVEHRWAVCATLLGWLRLFFAPVAVPWPGRRPAAGGDVVAQSVLRAPGLGMRAPPVRCAAGRS